MEMTKGPDAHNPLVLPMGIPVPRDDGAARHLAGAVLPDVELPATDGSAIKLSKLSGRTGVYIYPRTGVPGVALPDGWDEIPGARGCTPQSCAFRDHFDELRRLGVAHLYGLSTQDTAYQKEAAIRLHLPFALLSDEKLAFAKALNLPTFSVAGMTLLKRMALIIDDGRIIKAFYPVFPPDKNAAEVAAWLQESR
jgi:peroxiredoxin